MDYAAAIAELSKLIVAIINAPTEMVKTMTPEQQKEFWGMYLQDRKVVQAFFRPLSNLILLLDAESQKALATLAAQKAATPKTPA
jgi:hypothetical protein